MNVIETNISGVLIIEGSRLQDERGSLSRLFCVDELETVLDARTIKQINHSVTRRVGAVRGLHYQYPPHAEMKIVRCLKGKVFDVAVDLRHGSPTFMQWVSMELSPAIHRALVIPEGCAHGFQVLEPQSELLYLHTALYTPAAEGAVRYDDPLIGVDWPLEPTDISAKDLSHRYLEKTFKGISR